MAYLFKKETSTGSITIDTNPYPAPTQCKLSEMRHHWWVAYRWENVTSVGDEEPVYIRGIPRPIEEADSASKEFHLSRVSRVTSEEAV